LVHEPNVLLLDEPTNDLDTDTLAALEDLLDGFAGTLVVVSHDRYLLERVCDRQMAMLGDADIRDLPGGVEEYLRLRGSVVGVGASSLTGASAGAATGVESGAAKSAAGSGGVPDGPTAAQTRAARKDMAKLERALERLARKEVQLHERMAAAAAEHTAVLALDAELRAVTAEREQVEEDWLAAADLLG